MDAAPKHNMTVSEYIAWAERQPSGRYELVRGQVVLMAPERARHNLAKFRAVKALDAAITRAGLPCTAYTDGMTVVIDETTAREPDALVQCGTPIDLDSLISDAPLIVVEVLSPSSELSDTGDKLSEYFSVPTIRHYLIVSPEKRLVIHHRRPDGADDPILTTIVREGDVVLDPPGLHVLIDDILLVEADG